MIKACQNNSGSYHRISPKQQVTEINKSMELTTVLRNINYVRNVLRGVGRHKEHIHCGYIYMKIWARERRVYGGTTAFG